MHRLLLLLVLYGNYITNARQNHHQIYRKNSNNANIVRNEMQPMKSFAKNTQTHIYRHIWFHLIIFEPLFLYHLCSFFLNSCPINFIANQAALAIYILFSIRRLSFPSILPSYQILQWPVPSAIRFTISLSRF